MGWLVLIAVGAIVGFIAFKSSSYTPPGAATRNKIVEGYINNKLKRINPKQEITSAQQLVVEKGIKDLNKLIEFNKKQLRYVPDPLGGLWDVQNTINETLARGGGDCDDFALLNMYVLHVLGYKSWYVTLVDSKITMSHTTTVVKVDDKLMVFDQGYIYYVNSESDIINLYNKLYNRKYIYIDVRDVNLSPTIITP